MSAATATQTVPPGPGSRSLGVVVDWLRELEECRNGGLITDDEYAVERAEKLAALMCTHRRLWLGWFTAGGACAAIAGSIAWARFFDWSATAAVAALGAVFGIAMLGRPCRDAIIDAQIRERMEILHALLAHDLITADEYLVYEERLQRGEGKNRTLRA